MTWGAMPHARPYGYRALRFWDNDVLADLDAVLEAIRQELLVARNRPE